MDCTRRALTVAFGRAFRNLFAFVSEKPPCALFTISLFATSLSLLFLVRIVDLADIELANVNEEWSVLMKHISAFDMCVSRLVGTNSSGGLYAARAFSELTQYELLFGSHSSNSHMGSLDPSPEQSNIWPLRPYSRHRVSVPLKLLFPSGSEYLLAEHAENASSTFIASISARQLSVKGSQMNARLHLRMRFPARSLLHAIQCAKWKLAPSRPALPVAPETSRHIPDLKSAVRSPPSPETIPAPRVPSQNTTARTATGPTPPHCLPQLVLNACLELFAPIGFLPSSGDKPPTCEPHSLVETRWVEGDEAHSGPRLQVVYKESHAELVNAKGLGKRRSKRQQQLSIGRARGVGADAKANANAGGVDEPPLVPRALEEVLLLDSFRPAPRGSALASELVGQGSPSGRCGRRVRLSLQHPVDHAHILALTKKDKALVHRHLVAFVNTFAVIGAAIVLYGFFLYSSRTPASTSRTPSPDSHSLLAYSRE